MLTFSQQQTLFQDLAIDTSAAALTFGKSAINIGTHILETELGTHILEETRTGSTSTSTNVIQLPENCIRVKAFYVTVGGIQYNAQEIYDEDTWREIQANTQASTSDRLRFFYVRRGILEMFPLAASSNTYTLIYEATSKDLFNDDYTTGTITTLANGGTAVTGSGTTFTQSMVGRQFKIDADGQWYEIGSFTNATSIGLVKPYQGSSISAGSASFVIGEASKLPEATHHIPVYYALWQYSLSKKDAGSAAMYKGMYEQYMQWAKATFSRRYSSQVIPNTRKFRIFGLLNPNDYPRNVS